MDIESVDRIIRTRALFAPDERILIALSGGGDSVCLFHVLRQLAPAWGWRIACAHLNHGLRPEANREQAFVEALCARYGVQLQTGHADVARLAKQAGRGVEEQGRIERYRLFREAAGASGCGAVALAHHRDDQCETVLLNLIRGASLSGLGGMRRRRGRIVRPLLDFDKASLLDYLRECGFDWCEDESNRDVRYRRNLVRQEILPLMRRINPQLSRQMHQTGLLLQRDADALSAWASDWYARHVCELGRLALFTPYEVWAQAPAALRDRFCQRAFARMSGRPLEKRHLLGIEEALQQTGRIDLPAGVFFARRQDRMVCGRKGTARTDYARTLRAGQTVELAHGLCARMERLPVEAFHALPAAERGGLLCFHADADLAGPTLMLRNRTAHDALRQEHHHKSVRKVFSGTGLGAHASRHLPVVCRSSDGRPLWAPGARVAPDVRVVPTTRDVLCVRLFTCIETTDSL